MTLPDKDNGENISGVKSDGGTENQGNGVHLGSQLSDVTVIIEAVVVVAILTVVTVRY